MNRRPVEPAPPSETDIEGERFGSWKAAVILAKVKPLEHRIPDLERGILDALPAGSRPPAAGHPAFRPGQRSGQARGGSGDGRRNGP